MGFTMQKELMNFILRSDVKLEFMRYCERKRVTATELLTDYILRLLADERAKRETSQPSA